MILQQKGAVLIFKILRWSLVAEKELYILKKADGVINVSFQYILTMKISIGNI